MRLDLKAPEAAKVKFDCVRAFLLPTDIQIHVSWGTRLLKAGMARNADTGESKYVSPSFLTKKQQWQCLWGKKNEQLANVVSSAEQTRRQACSEWAQVSRRDLAWPGQDCSVRAPIARPCFSSVKLHSMENSSFSESKSHVARSICFDSYLFYLCEWG